MPINLLFSPYNVSTMQNHPSTIRKYLHVAIICSGVLLSSCKPSQSMDSLDGDTPPSIKNKERHRETDFSLAHPEEPNPTPPTAAVHVKEKLKKLPAPSPQEQAETKTAIKDYLNQHPEQKDTFHNLTRLLDLNEGYFIDGCASIGGGLEAFEGFMKILSHDFDQIPRHKPDWKVLIVNGSRLRVSFRMIV